MARAGERTPPDDVEALNDDASHDGETSAPRLFKGRPLESYTSLATNPYLSLHAELGRPAMTSEAAAACKGRWHEEFGREAPLHVEIGAGNGFFLSGMAARHPEFNWLGVEIRFKRVVLTARKLLKVQAEGWSRITRYDGNALPDLLRPGELRRAPRGAVYELLLHQHLARASGGAGSAMAVAASGGPAHRRRGGRRAHRAPV